MTERTGAQTPVGPTEPDPAARVRRLIGSAREQTDGAPAVLASPAGVDLLSAALARFDAPADLRIRGGLGSGRRTLAAALRERRGWRPEVDDLDVLAAAGAPVAAPPDAEIVCLRTAPCRHEEQWVRRRRAHPLLVVATGVEQSDPPPWARGLHTLDAREASHRSVDGVVAFLDQAVFALATARVARLEAELQQLAVHDDVGELAEAALCALTGAASLSGSVQPSGSAPS